MIINVEGDDPRRRDSRPDSNPLVEGLERLRECFEQRLGRLEALACDRASRPVAATSDLEQDLVRRIAEHEEAQARLGAQADRREQEWRASLEQIEGDRRLLAEAWERLERERIEGTTTATAATTAAQDQGRSAANERARAAPVRPRPDQADPANDSVTHAILQQFHALRNDVRRNARQRGPHMS